MGRPLILRVVDSLELTTMDTLLIVYHKSLDTTEIRTLVDQEYPHLMIEWHRLEHRTRGAQKLSCLGLIASSEPGQWINQS